MPKELLFRLMLRSTRILPDGLIGYIMSEGVARYAQAAPKGKSDVIDKTEHVYGVIEYLWRDSADNEEPA